MHRYLLIAVYFLIQAAAVGLADLLPRETVARLETVVSLVTVMWGNSPHIRRLADLGRGEYLAILELFSWCRMPTFRARLSTLSHRIGLRLQARNRDSPTIWTGLGSHPRR